MIKYVFIDIDDTLLDFDKNATLAVKMAFEKVGLDYKEEYGPWFLKINEGLWRLIEEKKLDRKGLHARRFKDVLREFGLDGDGDLIEKLFREYLFDLAIPVDGAVEILEYLSKKYIVCAASNAIYLQQVNRLKMAGMYEYLSKLFVSENIGYNKPSKEFFDACFLELADATVENTVMIGDSLSADIKGASDYGIPSIWFNKKGMEEPCEKKYFAKIENLKDIVKYL